MEKTNDVPVLGIFIGDLNPWETSSRGIVNFVGGLLKGLDESNREGFSFRIYFSREASEFFNSQDFMKGNLETFTYHRPLTPSRRIWRTFVSSHLRASRDQVDLMYFPRGPGPLPFIRRGKTAVTIHDLIPGHYLRHHRMHFLTNPGMMTSWLGCHLSIYSSKVSTVSRGSLVASRKCHDREFPIIPNSIDLHAPTDVEKFGVTPLAQRRFLFAIMASSIPHKCTEMAIEYALKLRRELGDNRQIVLLGSSMVEVSRKRESSGAFICLENPSDEDLASALRASAFLLFLSKIEGFGRPVFEAWSVGTPAITRRLPPFCFDLPGFPGQLEDVSFTSLRLAIDELLLLSPQDLALSARFILEQFSCAKQAEAANEFFRAALGQ